MLSLVENYVPAAEVIGTWEICRNSLAVQWLGFGAFSAEGPGLISGWVCLGRSCTIFEMTVACRTRDVLPFGPKSVSCRCMP